MTEHKAEWETVCNTDVEATDRLRVPGPWLYRSTQWVNSQDEMIHRTESMVRVPIPEGDADREVRAARWIGSARALLAILKRQKTLVGNEQLCGELLADDWLNPKDWDEEIAEGAKPRQGFLVDTGAVVDSQGQLTLNRAGTKTIELCNAKSPALNLTGGENCQLPKHSKDTQHSAGGFQWSDAVPLRQPEMTRTLLASFRDDLESISDPDLPAWLVEGAKLCARTLDRQLGFDRSLLETPHPASVYRDALGHLYAAGKPYLEDEHDTAAQKALTNALHVLGPATICPRCGTGLKPGVATMDLDGRPAHVVGSPACMP